MWMHPLRTSVCMGRVSVVYVFVDMVVDFARGLHGVHMNRGIGKIPQVMQQTMAYLLRNVMSLLHDQRGVDGNIQLGMEPMP